MLSCGKIKQFGIKLATENYTYIYVYIKRRLNAMDVLTLISETYNSQFGPGSSVSITTGYGLDGLGIESRWGARFSVPVQTGPGAHPPSCTMGTGSFPGVKSGRNVTLTPHPLLVPWSRKSRAIPQLPLWAARTVQSLSACTRVHLTLLYLLPYRSRCLI